MASSGTRDMLRRAAERGGTVQPREQSGLSDADVQSQLRGHLAALREMGPEWQDPLVEAFLSRVEQRVDERVDRRVQERLSAMPALRSRSTSRLAISLAFAVPLMAIAGGFAGLTGVVLVLGAILLLNWDQIIPR